MYLHITRLKPPAGYDIPLEAFDLPRQKLQGAKFVAGQSGITWGDPPIAGKSTN
jgi:hypothetical protein